MTINANRYQQTLTKLKSDIHNKRRTKPKPMILHHDNARPHTAKKTSEVIEKLNFNLLPHPPYSPDLAPADFCLFPKMKALLRGHLFDNRDNLEREVRRVLLYELPKEVYSDAINSLRLRWQKCVQLNGGYVEKVSVDLDSA